MSNCLVKTLDFYITSSVHVALSVYALVRITLIDFQLPYDESVAYFAFYGTIVGYNFIKYDELARVKKVVWHTQLKLITLLSLVSAICCGYYFLQLNQITQIIGIGALLLTGFYALPMVPKRTNFRNWCGVKIYLVALSWAIVTGVLPVMNAEIELTSSIWIYVFQRFLIVFVLMLIFEIVDLSKDDLSLQTIPQQLGVSKTKRLGYGLLLFYWFLEVARYNFNGNVQCQLIPLLFVLVIASALFFVHPARSKYYTSFWVELIPVLWWMLS